MSGNRRSEDAGEIPWPALVDLLTSVLITFMFFILVTTVAMSAMTIKQATEKSEKKEQGQKVSETEVVSDTITGVEANAMPSTVPNPSTTLLPPPPSLKTSEDPLTDSATEQLKAENELLKQQLAAMGASFAKSKDIKTVAEPTGDALSLLFNPNEAGMVPAVEVALLKFVRSMQAKHGAGAEIRITASEPTGVSFSQARERALTRAMVVRNVLLENGIEAARVSFRYDTGERFKSRNWVRLQVGPGQ